METALAVYRTMSAQNPSQARITTRRADLGLEDQLRQSGGADASESAGVPGAWLLGMGRGATRAARVHVGLESIQRVGRAAVRSPLLTVILRPLTVAVRTLLTGGDVADSGRDLPGGVRFSAVPPDRRSRS